MQIYNVLHLSSCRRRKRQTQPKATQTRKWVENCRICYSVTLQMARRRALTSPQRTGVALQRRFRCTPVDCRFVSKDNNEFAFRLFPFHLTILFFSDPTSPSPASQQRSETNFCIRSRWSRCDFLNTTWTIVHCIVACILSAIYTKLQLKSLIYCQVLIPRKWAFVYLLLHVHVESFIA